MSVAESQPMQQAILWRRLRLGNHRAVGR